MFGQLLKFEAFYQLKQRAFPLFALLFVIFGYLAGSNGFAPSHVNFNAGYQAHNFIGLFSLGSVFITMFFVISAILRDGRYKMDSIIYSTSVQKMHFFWSRFAGVFLFSVLAFTPFLIGMILGHHLAPHDPERLAPFSLMSYLLPWLTMAVPNIFICTTVIFSVSALSKNNLATYASAVFIYMCYMICSIFLNSPLMAQSIPASPEAMAVAALADPFGISAFFEQTQYWTAFEKNAQLVSFSGLFMWNRIIWMGVALLLLLITYRLFSFRKLDQKVKKEKALARENTTPVPYRTLEPETSFKSNLASFFSMLKIDLTSIAKSLPFAAVMLIWVIISISEIYSRLVIGAEYSSVLYMFTNQVIIHILDPLRILGIVLIIFYSGEIVWSERSLNFNGIVDATPVANWAIFMSKLFSLLLLPAILIGSGIIIGISFQLISGFMEIDLGQYLSMFYFNGLQLFLFSVLAVFVQSLVHNKYLGMGIVGLMFLGTFLFPQIGIEHIMLRFGLLPDVEYTNMTGYGGEVLQFFHLSIYWVGLAGLMAMISFKLWQRGIAKSLKLQLKELVSNWNNAERTGLAVFLIIFATGGSIAFYNIHIVNDYFTSDDVLDYREAYERKFKPYESIPQLYPVNIRTSIDLYPQQSRCRVEANYEMVNRDNQPISTFLVSGREPLESITFENAKLIEHDAEFDTYLFEFNPAIQPQETVRLNYILNYKSKGYDFNQEIVENGSYFSHRSFEPYMGYRSGLEIATNFEREKRGLPAREEDGVTDAHLALDDVKAGRVSFETTISTSGDEIALSSGKLLKQWNENGRNFFHYKADHKVLPTMGYFSSAYEIKKEVHNGISIEQYYHPNHDFNIDSVISSTKETLDYCIANFGEYSSEYIRMAEIPSHWGFGGFAHPNMISMVEDRMYLTDISNPAGFNLPAKRTIHEVAHQWWGHILAPKVVEGGSIFIEGLAKYTEAVVMEKIYGKRAIYELSQNVNNRYFTGRAWSSTVEPPMYLVMGQSYISYGKNYNVMIALRDLIGEGSLNSVLRTITDRYRDDIQFSATSLELLDELYKVAPIKHHTLIDDWFKRVITYDISIEEVSLQKLDNGNYEITMSVNAKRFETQESGEASPIDINEPIQIGLFDRHPSLIGKNGGTIYLKPHQITQDGQQIKIIVDELPMFVGIDSYGTRVDENIYDNVKRL